MGRRRIGLAGCDPLGLSITRLPALLRGTFPADREHLAALAASRGAITLVVGLPLDRHGQLTPQALHCRRYGERLARSLQLPIAWVNEHASTWAAGERFGIHGDRTGRLDSAAAALLLEQWLLEGPAAEPVATAAIAAGSSCFAAPS